MQRVLRFGAFELDLESEQLRHETGAIRLRPLQDVNARYTMGRLALGFGRVLRPGWCGTWVHFSRRHLAGRKIDAWLAGMHYSLPDETITAVTSPRAIDSESANHHAVLVLASTPESRRRAETAVFGSLGITVAVDEM
jgi:hypothetical protein